MRDEHFEVISENRARKYELDKKELQHKGYGPGAGYPQNKENNRRFRKIMILRHFMRLCHHKRNVGGISFFFYRKLVGGTVAQRVFLAY